MKLAILGTLFYILIVFILFYACRLARYKDEVKEFIPGVFARHYKDEYTDSYDTIVIKAISPEGSDDFVVIKRSRYNKQTNEGTTEPGYEFKKWAAVYDKKTKRLWLPVPGKSIYFDPKRNFLKIGTEPYKKL